MQKTILETCLDFTTLTEALAYWSAHSPDATALSFREGDSATTLTYSALQSRALAVAGEITQKCMPGDRVVLGYEQGIDYVAGFLGCVYAGVVAVTSAPPTELRRSERLIRLLDDSGARAILSNGAAKAAFEAVQARVTLIDTDHIAAPALTQPVTPEAEQLMFLQYTSGSTSAPKGVMLTHGSIGANLRAILADTQPDEGSIYMSWLPLYHDMGLIFMTLAPLFAGRPVHLMSPAEFLRFPERWLQAISDLGATITAAPNFAYRLCCDRVQGRKAEALNLSSMRRFINGSEPIRVEDMELFLDTFAASGLCPEAMTGGYGMAELGVYACLGPAFVTDTYFDAQLLADEARAVALPSAAQGTCPPARAVRRLAACGAPNAAHFDLRIVDPETGTEQAEGASGEIWIAGPSVGRGYWRNPQATAETFGAALAPVPDGFGQNGYLRTGDIGFMHDGQLFICGRSKEMMILRGRNLFPADICEAVELVGPAMRGRRAAAFTVPGEPDEELVIVCAARAANPDAAGTVIRQIIAAVSREIGVVPVDIVIVSNRALSRTTSGKVQHAALRKAYLEGGLEAEFSLLRGSSVSSQLETALAAAQSAPAPAPDWMVQRICAYAAAVAGRPLDHADCDLFELGLDSLRGMRLIERIETGLLRRPSALTLADLSELRTPRRIADALGALATGNARYKELVL